MLSVKMTTRPMGFYGILYIIQVTLTTIAIVYNYLKGNIYYS